MSTNSAGHCFPEGPSGGDTPAPGEAEEKSGVQTKVTPESNQDTSIVAQETRDALDLLYSGFEQQDSPERTFGGVNIVLMGDTAMFRSLNSLFKSKGACILTNINKAKGIGPVIVVLNCSTELKGCLETARRIERQNEDTRVVVFNRTDESPSQIDDCIKNDGTVDSINRLEAAVERLANSFRDAA